MLEWHYSLKIGCFLGWPKDSMLSGQSGIQKTAKHKVLYSLKGGNVINGYAFDLFE
jgi:hypothetical protein